MRESGRTSWKAAKFLYVVVGIGYLSWMARPNFANHRTSAFDACFEQQRRFQGALEMYNLDEDTTHDVLTPEIWRALVERGYLERLPDDPLCKFRRSPGTGWHYRAATYSRSGVTCLRHGPEELTEEWRERLGPRFTPRQLLLEAGERDPAALWVASEECHQESWFYCTHDEFTGGVVAFALFFYLQLLLGVVQVLLDLVRRAGALLLSMVSPVPGLASS